MRKLMAVIAMVLVLPTSSWALLGLEELTYDGSLETNVTRAANEVDQSDGSSPDDRHSDVDTRLRLGINMTVTEGVAGRLELTRTGSRYGRNFAGSAEGANSISDEESNILVNNAYVSLADIFGVMAMIGRMYVGDEGDLVWNIGPRSDDILSVDAVDGVVIGRNWDRLRGRFSLLKAEENNPQGGAVELNEISLKELMLGYMISSALDLRLQGIWGSDSNGSDTSDSTKLRIYRAGVRGNARDNFFTYRADYLMNAGEDLSGAGKIDFGGSAIDLGAGVNLPETGAGTLGFGAGYLMASGDDDTTDTDDDSFRDLRAVGIWSSDRYYGEILGRSNVLASVPPGVGADTGAQGTGVTILHLSGLFKPAFAPKSWVRLDFYDFSATEDEQNGVSVGDIGTEIDLTFGYRHSDNVGFEAGYATLSPDDQITGGSGNPDDNITKWFARMKLAWGEMRKGGGMTQIDPPAEQ